MSVAGFVPATYHELADALPLASDKPALDECTTGVYVNGECCLDSGFRVPSVGGGLSGYYTTYSGVFLAIAVALFAAVLVPLTAVNGDSTWSDPAVLFGLVPPIAAAGINSCGVFVGSQVMLGHEYRLWDQSDDHENVTVSADLMSSVMWGNLVGHTVPMIVAVIMLGALFKMAHVDKSKIGGVVGATLAWMVALMIAYGLTPVSKDTTPYSADEDKHPLPLGCDTTSHGGDVLLMDKLDTVYGPGKLGAAALVLGINVLGAGASGLLMQ